LLGCSNNRNGEVGTVRWRSEMDDIVTERIEDQITEGVTMESFHDVGAMCFDCFDAQIEQSGYFFARLAFRKKLNNLSLTRS